MAIPIVSSVLGAAGSVASSVVNAGAGLMTGIGAIANLVVSPVFGPGVGNAIGNALTPGGRPYGSDFKISLGNFDWAPENRGTDYVRFDVTRLFSGSGAAAPAEAPPPAAAPELAVTVDTKGQNEMVAGQPSGGPGTAGLSESQLDLQRALGAAATKPESLSDRLGREVPFSFKKFNDPASGVDYAAEYAEGISQRAFQLALEADADPELAEKATLAPNMLSGPLARMHEKQAELNELYGSGSAVSDVDLGRAIAELDAAKQTVVATANSIRLSFSKSAEAQATLAKGAQTALAGTNSAIETARQLVKDRTSTLHGPEKPDIDGEPARLLRKAERSRDLGLSLMESDPAAAQIKFTEAAYFVEDAERASQIVARSTYSSQFRIRNRVTDEAVGWDWDAITPWLSTATTIGLAYLQSEKQEKADEKNRRYLEKQQEADREFQREMQRERLEAQMAMAETAADAASPAAVGASATHVIGGGTASA